MAKIISLLLSCSFFSLRAKINCHNYCGYTVSVNVIEIQIIVYRPYLIVFS